MSNPVESISPDDPTLEAMRPIAMLPKPDVSQKDRAHPLRVQELVAGDTESSLDALSLIQTRLRVAALALGFGLLVFLVWSFVNERVSQHRLGRIEIFVLHFVTTISLIGIGIWLGLKKQVSLRCLRACELLIFGLPAVLFTALQYFLTVFIAMNFDVIAVMPFTGWLILILTYAIFVPNSWRRVLVVVSVMGLMPILACGFAMLRYPGVRQAIMFDPGSSVEMLLGLVVTIFIAVSSVRMITSLRDQASEAKQLGRYHLKEKLGAGGMGEVYLAEHTLLKRPCAIKVIRPEKTSDPRALARFEREVQAASQLSHWNSIYIYDYGRTADGVFFYVMEYLTGLSLQQLVKKRGPLCPARVVYLLKQVCEALSEAHARQLIHRDVKPANIMVTELGGAYDVAKLLDFGLVKPLTESISNDEELTLIGTVTGSPMYMSPEQAVGEVEIDERSDIYSLGAVAYFALTGRPLFERASPLKIMMAHANEQPMSLAEAKSAYLEEFHVGSAEPISEAVEAIIMKCLAKNPNDRFQSARELSDALRKLPEANSWDERLAEAWWESNCAHYQGAHG